MDRRRFLRNTVTGSVAAAAAAGVTSRTVSAEETFNWRMAMLYPRGSAFEPDYEGFTALVREMSGGRLNITNHYDGEGITATEVYTATKSGLFEMGAPYMALHAGEFPAGVVEVGLPGGPSDFSELASLFYRGGWVDYLRKAYLNEGVYYLGPYFQPGVYIITKSPINSLADLNGMVLRAPGAYGTFMKSFGVSPVSMSFSELYTSLATGVVDGACSSNLVDYRDGQLIEVAKYMYPVAVTGSQVSNFMVNKDAWDSLPDDLKAVLDAATVWHCYQQIMTSTVEEKLAVAAMEKQGLVWTPAPTAEDQAKWRSAIDELWSQYENGDQYSRELIALQREFMTKLGL